MTELEEIVLIALDNQMCEEWKKAFASRPNIKVLHQRFETLEDYDCLVSPANSYGFMDGGMDKAISDYFTDIGPRVRREIAHYYGGYQPVGTSLIVQTGNEKHPYLAHTPTMRVPTILTGARQENIYNAMWATLQAIKAHNYRHDRNNGKGNLFAIKKVVIPAFGLGVGKVPAQTVAQMMALAYSHYLSGGASKWETAIAQDRDLLGVMPF